MTQPTKTEEGSGIGTALIAVVIIVLVAGGYFLVKNKNLLTKTENTTPIEKQDTNFAKNYCDKNGGTFTTGENWMNTCTLPSGQIIQFGDEISAIEENDEASEPLPTNPENNESESISSSNLDAEEAQIKADEEALTKDFKGLTLEEANKLAESRGLETRVTSMNGVAQAVTADLRMNRVNFDIVNDKVENVTIG